MSVSYVLPLKAPAPLPASGVDIVTFKVWKNTLVAHIAQDANHYHYIYIFQSIVIYMNVYEALK